MSEDSLISPFVPHTTPAIDRANRLMSIRSNPGFLDVVRISQDIVNTASQILIEYPGWDKDQMMVLKVRAQAAQEHHKLLLKKIEDAIANGIEEQREQLQHLSVPDKSPQDIIEQGDLVRQAVLTQFEKFDTDTRIPGSY